MTKALGSRMVLVAFLGGSLVGCTKEPAPPPPAKAPEKVAEKVAEAPAAPPPKAEPAKPAAPATVTAADYVDKMGPKVCTWFVQCKNDKVKAIGSMMAMMVAGFGSMDKPDLAKRMKTVNDAMKKEKRWAPTEPECGTVVEVAMAVTGMSKDTLAAKLDKTVKFDGEKGQACLATFGSPLALCDTEVKLDKEPKMKDVEAFEKEVKAPLDAYLKPCEGVFTGMLATGAACEYDYECAGEHAKCHTGKAPKKAKKGEKPPRVCEG